MMRSGKRGRRCGGLAALVAAGGLACLSRPAGAWEASMPEVEGWSRLSTNYVTPHFEWAKPYAGGRLRVLYFVGSASEGMDDHARPLVELMERFDLAIDPVYWSVFYKADWYGGGSGYYRLWNLLSRNRYDVFVFENISPASLPTWPGAPKPTFLAAVSNGAGVVLINAGDDGLLKGKVNLESAPAFLAGVPLKETGKLGKGRVVTLPAPALIPYRAGWTVAYDHQLEKIGRALFWAAGREPDVGLRVNATPGPVQRSALPAGSVKCAWDKAPMNATVDIALRRDDGFEIALPRHAAPAGAGGVDLTVPVIPAGTYDVDTRLFVDGRVAAWATTNLVIAPATSVKSLDLKAPREIPRATVDKQPAVWEQLGIYTPSVEPGESIQIAVETEGPSAGKKLQVRLRDSAGRILQVQTFPVGSAQSATVRAAEWMPMLVRVEAVILDGATEEASAWKYFRVTKRRRGQFNLVLWDFPSAASVAPYAAESLRRMGVTAIYGLTPPPLAAAANELSWVSYTGGQIDSGTAEQWNDPAYAGYWVNHTGRSAPHGALAYSLGDEGATAGYGNGPRTMAAYRQYLQTVYPDIKAVNAAWGASYADFEAMEVFKSKPPEKPAAPAELPNLAAGYDLFAFGGYNFAQMAKIHVQEMRKTRDPQAVIGFEGAGSAFAHNQACDPYLICRELGMWAPYCGMQDEIIRSVAPRQFIRGNWMGYHRTAEGHLSRFWRGAMLGHDSAWYWMWSAVGAFQGFEKPDFTGGVPPVEEFLADTRFFREGLGDLLLKYEMLDDGIALLYSHPSHYFMRASRFGAGYGDMRYTQGCWTALIQDLGMQFRYVDERQIQDGSFPLAKYKLLILSESFALSPKSAAAIAKFVSDGGTVLADFRPALYDEHCRPVEAATGRGQLDDLFGVTGGILPEKVGLRPMAIQGQAGAITAGTFTVKETMADPTVKLKDGTALGQAGDSVPVCIVKKTGQGQAILLNFALWTATGARAETPHLGGQANDYRTPPAPAAFFKGLLRSAGVTGMVADMVPWKNPAGLPALGNMRVQFWKNGDNLVLGLFRETGSPIENLDQHASVVLGMDARHMYDIRHDLYLGQTGWWFYDILPSRALFYALLPKECPAAMIELPKQAARGALLKARISVPAAVGLHALRLRAQLPDGRPAGFWEQTVLVGKEPRELDLPVAVNDPAGAWTITFTDVFTSETRQELKLDVK